MSLAGLSLAQLLGLAGAGAAAIAALYLLRLRRRRVPVAFLALWSRVAPERRSARLWGRLRHLLSLLVQVALLALLLAAVADPRRGADAGARHLAIVIDASASMQATDVAPSRLARARDEARRLVRGLSGSDLALVVAADHAPRPMGPLSDDRAALLAQVDAVTATDAAADMERALAIAHDALHGRPRAEVVIVSDGAFPDAALAPGAGLDLRFVPVGTASAVNAGIVAFGARRDPADPATVEVLLEAVAHAAAPLPATIEVYAGADRVHREQVVLAPGQPLRRVRALAAGAAARLTARVRAEGDALAADDRAFAVVAERAVPRVLLVSDGNLFLLGALLAIRDLAPERVSPADYRPEQADHDVVIFDRVAPAPPPRAHLLYLAPEAGGPFPRAGLVRDPVVTDVHPSHPLARHLVLRDVNARVAVRLSPRTGDVAIASSFSDPIALAREQDGRRMAAFGLDARESDLPLRAAFPILLVNAIDWLAGGEGETRLLSAPAGRALRVPVGAAEGAVEVVSPSGRRLSAPVAGGGVVVVPDEAGFWEAGGTAFSASLADAAESRIAARRKVGPAAARLGPPDPPRRSARRALWPLCAAAALALALVEWGSYHRRWTV